MVSMEECSLEPENGWIISLKTEKQRTIIKYLVSTDGCYAFVEVVTNGDEMDKLCKRKLSSNWAWIPYRKTKSERNNLET